MDFGIRLDLFVKCDIWTPNNWMDPPAVLGMVSMLPHKNVEELFVGVINDNPDRLELKEWLGLAESGDDDGVNENQRRIRDENRWRIRDYLYNNNSPNENSFNLYYIYQHRYFGVNLNQPIEI